PNGDGINDLYFIKASGLKEVNATIYDRWGHVVYELKNEKGRIEWDGKNQYGKDCAEGTYFFVIKATGEDGTAYDEKGTITLVR
ncbi:MAG: gliding motility-associated C-terminal domain-containing protein, partial [Bacteroidia bacterium]|nr:gliding motility-associated C-terminal domain-containing protein [Bacteroidia bacterium]